MSDVPHFCSEEDAESALREELRGRCRPETLRIEVEIKGGVRTMTLTGLNHLHEQVKETCTFT